MMIERSELTLKEGVIRVDYKLNGKSHREDGPAVEFSEGSKIWCKHGEYHRLDGPAIKTVRDKLFNGAKSFYVYGCIIYPEEMSYKSFLSAYSFIRLKYATKD